MELFEQIVEPVFQGEMKYITDSTGRILISSTDQLGLNLGKGQNLLEMLGSTKNGPPVETWIRTLQSNQTMDHNIGIENGDTMNWYRVLAQPLLLDGAVFFLIQFLDITEYMVVSEQLRKNQSKFEHELLLRTKEIALTEEIMGQDGGFLPNFLRGLRHDLKSPLAQLRQIIDYERKAEDPQKKEQAKGLINDCLDKLTVTANGFSDFVDLHFLPQREAEEVSFAAVFGETKNLLSEAIQKARPVFKTDFSEAPTVWFPEKMLSSIFYNLLSNSLKFKAEERPLEIKIWTAQQPDKVTLYFADNGKGMDLAKYGDQLYQPFKRLNMTHSGAGIGLTLVKKLLDKFKGIIHIESAVNQGTTIRMEFIVKPNPAELQSK